MTKPWWIVVIILGFVLGTIFAIDLWGFIAIIPNIIACAFVIVLFLDWGNGNNKKKG